MDPCLTVGDLLIALESEKIPVFYTINAKESQYLPLDGADPHRQEDIPRPRRHHLRSCRF
jgi:hypothetical protein